jgi:hypothetical protein
MSTVRNDRGGLPFSSPTMTIRTEALRWLASRRIHGGHVVTSKRYAPDESWTGEKAWWVQIPAEAVRQGHDIHVVCEADAGPTRFHHLRVPADFLLEHLDYFATIGVDKINLFLSAEAGHEFEDQRGPGRISFAAFEQR